jgi:hypothetical protein
MYRNSMDKKFDTTQGVAGVASQGGIARAKSLSPEERSEIARRAVEKRWQNAGKLPTIPKATHEGTLKIGNVEISCAVLENGQRVLSQAEFLEALGRHRKANVRKEIGEERVPPILQGKAIKPFISKEILEKSQPLAFRTSNGVRASGYRADLLPSVCEIYLKARDAGQLPTNQTHVAKQAEILIRGLAAVGIIALVDEATGFQYDRPRRDLEEQLRRFLSENLRRWVRTFPEDYFKHLCRLRNVELRPDMKLPQYFGQLTNNLVYRRLAPGLLKKLKDRKLERGNPSNKLHSWLSEDVGFRGVLVHLGIVVGLMKIHKDYAAFERQLDEIAPIYAETPGLFDNPHDWEEPK